MIKNYLRSIALNEFEGDDNYLNLALFSSNSKSSNIIVKDLIEKRHQEIKLLVITSQIKGNTIDKLKTLYKYSKKTSQKFLIYKVYESYGGNSAIKLAKKYHIPIIHVQDVNDYKLINKIKSINIDLNINCFANQIFKKEVIQSAKKGTLNIHGSLLPKYRGSAQYFWYLYNNDSWGGVTIHFMDEGLDTGDILLQEKFKINAEDTMLKLHYKISQLGAKLCNEVVDRLETNSIKAFTQPIHAGSYLKIPTKEEMKSFSVSKIF